MKSALKIFVILAFGVSVFATSSSAQNADEIKQANTLMQQAGMQLLVYRNYEAACSLYEKAGQIYHRQNGKDDRKYLEAIKGVADCHEKMGNVESAIAFYRKILKSNDIWQTDYACLKLGRLYQQIDNVDAAIDAYTIGISQYKKNGGRWNNNYFSIYKELYRLDYSIGNTSEAARVCAELCDLIRVDKPRWIALSADLATIYQESDNHLDAIRTFHEVLSVYKEGVLPNADESVTQKYNIAEVLRGIGWSYQKIGNYSEAIDYLHQSYDKFNGLDRGLARNRLFVMMQLSVCYSELNDHASALRYARDAYEAALKEGFDENDKMILLTNYANILLTVKEYGKAQSLLSDAVAVCKDDKIKASICNSLAAMYGEHGMHEEALKYMQQAVSLDSNPVYLHNLSVCCADAGRHDMASAPLIKGWEMAVNTMAKELLQNSGNDYGHIWNKYKIQIKAPVTMLWQTDDADVLRYAYNSVLMTKSIQLATSLRFRSIINNCGDPYLKNLYDEWLKRTEEQKDCLEMELELLAKVNSLSSYSNVFNIRWDDIRDALKKGEVAVEFTHIKRTDTAEKAYVALVLTPGATAPECVFLNFGNEIDRLYKDSDINGLYNSAKAGDMIWEKVVAAAKKTCPDINTIYFVPDGVLYSMSIEHMTSKGFRMSEKYDMRRLSSTREIMDARNGLTSDGRAVLFGGIDYSATVEDMEYYAYTVSNERSAGDLWTYLPGTQEEITQIDRILSGSSYSTKVHSGASCVEESFKMYSGKSPEIIHIATHGFYKLDDNTSDQETVTDEGISLKKCGLAFAGANQSILGSHNIPDDVDDGILSASEISKLDLSKTKLVVMSACQTGLGDVDDDGVFGLQRAFKKAGAHSIMMSMWNVDDKVTQNFMSRFYKGLAEGMTRQKALAAAQTYVKQTYGDDPYYWAPFVILD